MFQVRPGPGERPLHGVPERAERVHLRGRDRNGIGCRSPNGYGTVFSSQPTSHHRDRSSRRAPRSSAASSTGSTGTSSLRARLSHSDAVDATTSASPAGCIALRRIENDVCEMKRLFVRPGFRGRGVGKLLAERIVDEGRAIGYRTMKLDTLPSMQAAIRLYETAGFVRCAPYYETPLAQTIFMELQL